MSTRYNPVEAGWEIESPFGHRINPVTGADEGHLGTDFGYPGGSDGRKIYAAQAGTVQYIGAAQGFGQWVVLDHSDAEGGGCTLYGHMWNAFATGLSVGDHVDAGQHIAYIGSNGQATGPHLHFGVFPYAYDAGAEIDPIPWLTGALNPGEVAPPAAPTPQGGTAVSDELWSDVSEFQVPVDDSYPYDILAIRSNDGTYLDHNFVQNYAWGCRSLDSGKLQCLIIYFVYRTNWQDTLNTLISRFPNGVHPKVVFMLDVESWGGEIGGDNSDGINKLYWGCTDYLKTSQDTGTRRVIGYGNTYDLNTLWPNKPDGIRLIVAGYGANPDYPGKLGHQFTDGQVGGPINVPPFGFADVNSADGYDINMFLASVGLGPVVVPAPFSGGPLMALTDPEQQEVLAGIRYLVGQLGPWKQLGQNAQGQDLTLVDSFAEAKTDIAAIKAKEV
jgi:hypothetical protein